MPNFMNSIINNISYPTSVEELLHYIECDESSDVDTVVNDVLNEAEDEWTVARWSKKGDIVFFMHAKMANRKISKIRTELNNNKEKYRDVYDICIKYLDKAKSNYKMYGGKIFALGIVCGPAENWGNEVSDVYHFNSRIFAKIKFIKLLEHPLDLSKFNSFIQISMQSGITPVIGENYRRLCGLLVEEGNKVPEIVLRSISSPPELSRVNKYNWLRLGREYNRSYLYERQFRVYYVDYLLKYLGDYKTIFKECKCIKENMNHTFVDNVILFNKKYLPVEVKLSVLLENNLVGQVHTYANVDEILLKRKEGLKPIFPEEIYNNNVLIIDTEAIYLYEDDKNSYFKIIDLDDIEYLEFIKKVRSDLINLLK